MNKKLVCFNKFILDHYSKF